MPQVSDLQVSLHDTDRQSLFVRRWRPEPDTQGAPIVLLHDSLGCVELWRDLPEALCQTTGREVIAYDRLGFGQSTRHPDRLTHTFIADEAHQGFAALHRALKLEGFVVLGHSVGGCMAAGIAAHYDDCQALITLAAQAFVEERTLSGIRQARDTFALPGQIERLKKYHGDKARWVLDAWVETWLDPDFRGWALDDTLRRVRCPVLALHGDQDEYGSPEQPERYAQLPQGSSRMVLLEGCGHVPHREQPDRVLDYITSLLGEQINVDDGEEQGTQ
ncbi:alpha/beta hydrolase [Halomonas sp. SCS19]|uniref:alpha/beta fold hydrolase n=1 Tax=Halomonas sp. SCS19 TaxID=2950870 RepID=UPI0032DEF99C